MGLQSRGSALFLFGQPLLLGSCKCPEQDQGQLQPPGRKGLRDPSSQGCAAELTRASGPQPMVCMGQDAKIPSAVRSFPVCVMSRHSCDHGT